MHVWGRSPSGSAAESPPDAPQARADGRDISRGRGRSDVRPPLGLLCRAARCRPVRVALRRVRSILRPVSVLLLQLLSSRWASHLACRRTAPLLRHHDLQLLRWRDARRESERRPSTGGWFPALSPTVRPPGSRGSLSRPERPVKYRAAPL